MKGHGRGDALLLMGKRRTTGGREGNETKGNNDESNGLKGV